MSNCSCALLQELVKAVPRLRPHADRLVIDFLTLASSLRPAFLLDYAHGVANAPIEHACTQLNSCVSHHVRFSTVNWQGLVWVMNCKNLQLRLRRLLASAPAPPEMWLVSFEPAPELRPRLDAVADCRV